MLVLSSGKEIGAGKYKLTLDFAGNIRERAEWLFYVKYLTASGRKMMLSTQMEPTDARRMFPCWDEPVFKATYELTVVVPEKHLAVSNTPVEQEKRVGDGLKEVKFGRTPARCAKPLKLLVPRDGFEPPTPSLRMTWKADYASCLEVPDAAVA